MTADDAFDNWCNRFEDKLLEHLRSDTRLQRELRAEFNRWPDSSEPGSVAAYYLELIAKGRAAVHEETRRATEFYQGRALDERQRAALREG